MRHPCLQQPHHCKTNIQQALTIRESRREQEASSAQFCQRQTPSMPGIVRLLKTETTQSTETTGFPPSPGLQESNPCACKPHRNPAMSAKASAGSGTTTLQFNHRALPHSDLLARCPLMRKVLGRPHHSRCAPETAHSATLPPRKKSNHRGKSAMHCLPDPAQSNTVGPARS